MTEPECECRRCWAGNHPEDNQAPWLTVPPSRTWLQGTIRVAVPCVVHIAPGLLPPGIEVESECEFFGHSLASVRAAARKHLLAGPEECPVARDHMILLILPDGTKEPLYPA